ncbi:MAG: hypothetical protein OXF44_05635 [Anaerolineaceae bacterium]|nr:hypothetical protein [Anaerolineaceae bacterium]MCY4023609.1 hypothetical protein [Anaerolineaceae bacterium]
MHRRAWLCVMLIGVLVSACQGPPPTQIVLVVTATPEGFVAQADPGAATPGPDQAQQASPTTIGRTATSTAVSSPAVATTATPAPLPGTPFFTQPTPTVRQIQVAEQIFERGRMFWLQPTGQIWVLVVTGEGSGDWFVYEDVFQEGDLESDPDIVPPDDSLLQPIRGFGRLWRDNSDVRELLGWATTDEFGFVTSYEYHPTLRYEDGRFVAAPGEHVMHSLYGEGFRFIEESGSWRLN